MINLAEPGTYPDPYTPEELATVEELARQIIKNDIAKAVITRLTGQSHTYTSAVIQAHMVLKLIGMVRATKDAQRAH